MHRRRCVGQRGTSGLMSGAQRQREPVRGDVTRRLPLTRPVAFSNGSSRCRSSI